ncbi:MAG: twitching motility protein PilT [Ignavibacteriae bacterium HGW-Ignavibacteriae-2]|jgi:twitching motility protein PilT|nr:PilT/PilU family type 4a pilus ATPase [Bacteroidota bacterium]PKL90037.1 MAG: twitching motility protein PilT [Ignavibacteriae bacterium HGW-Ignavibacteriae-2]
MIDKAKEILTRFTSQIPQTILGPERVNFVVEKIKDLSSDDKLILFKLTNHILTLMIERNASDVEIGGYGTNGYVWFRIHGVKNRVEDLPVLTTDEASTLIITLLNQNQHRHLLVSRNLDFSYTFFHEKVKKNVRFRADAYFDLDSLALNMRAISATTRPIESLEFHPNAVKMMSHNYIKFGLSLVTGITGSGKSTTLDSIIDMHNKVDPCHIVIIAAPIEYVHVSNSSIVRHREVGRDVLSFKEGVIQGLRQDPDIIVIGEMRDPDTIMAALEVTDTGHKVFSTLHTSSATESIDRIIAEVNPVEQERVRNRLADVLITIVSQKLVPSTDGKRVLAKEVLIVTPSVRAAIKNNNTSEIYMMIVQGGPQGMITMEQDLLRLYQQRKITQENALSYANNKTRMLQIMRGV